jgi:hypothetical protein
MRGRKNLRGDKPVGRLVRRSKLRVSERVAVSLMPRR